MKVTILVLILSLLSAGCTQQSAQQAETVLPVELTKSNPVPDKPIAATVQRVDSTKILITYHGVPDADQLIELETTVISSKGSVNIQSLGSRLYTTPVQKGGTDIFQGPYTDKVHVLTIGYFTNGTHLDVLDTWI
ncbi:MAG TPA: hypothetical protein P5013_00120 [Methanoregula sp.]|nr:hypothetical protein [Methanoregula sp.]